MTFDENLKNLFVGVTSKAAIASFNFIGKKK